jgi:acyl transferase domain-containing protein
VVEVESLTEVFGAAPRSSIGLGSAKSNIGHLKAGAGAAGLLKAVMALHHKVLPPTLNAEKPNPNIDFANSPFYLLPRSARMDAAQRRAAPRRRQRLRLRRHQLPPGAGGVRAGDAWSRNRNSLAGRQVYK